MKVFRFSPWLGQAIFGGVLSALLVCGAFLMSVGWYAYQDLSDQTSRFLNYQALQKGSKRADSLSSIHASTLADLRSIRGALPRQNQASYVLGILVENARVKGLGIAGITALDELPFSGYRELPFEMNLTGDFPNLLRYLHSLESGSMILRVRRLSTHSDAMNAAKITAKLEMSVFVPAEASVELPSMAVVLK